MRLKEATSADDKRIPEAVQDGQGDLWFLACYSDEYVSPSACNIPTSLEDIEGQYGINQRFYEGDEITVIL